jgi:hypothetical protein
MKEEENAASGLVADAAGFFWSRGFCQEEPGALRAGRSYQDPALVAALAVCRGGVFHENESQRLSEEGNGFVVVANYQGYVA